jgi:hypothetical protein
VNVWKRKKNDAEGFGAAQKARVSKVAMQKESLA